MKISSILIAIFLVGIIFASGCLAKETSKIQAISSEQAQEAVKNVTSSSAIDEAQVIDEGEPDSGISESIDVSEEEPA